MADQREKGHFVERILHLMHKLDELKLEPGQVLYGDWPFLSFPSKEQEEYRAAVESLRFMDEMPGGFFIYYATGAEGLIYANRGVLRMFGCESLSELRQLTGNSFRGMIYPDDLDGVESSIRRQIASNQYDLDYVEYRIRRKDGLIRWVEDYGHFIHDGAAGDIFYVFLGESTDERSWEQTQQKRILSEALEIANAAAKAKNTFLSQMSHEMRTPMNAIFGFIALAKLKLNEPDTIKEYLDQVELASRQMLGMINQALEVSDLSGTAADAAQQECDLLDTLQEIYDFLEPQALEKHIAFSLDCQEITHRGVYTDPQHLRQLVMNLANNAITYTDGGGRVDIVLREENSMSDTHAVYRLEVRDTGVGISEEFLNQAFEPFSRDRSATLSGVRGIGLGLTIAKGIVDMLDGTISVKTAVNEGSTFTVMLPFQIQPMEDLPGKPSQGSAAGLRILLAEDNEINREIETELMERMGFLIEPAADGGEALEKMKAASPGDFDLLILDLQMPVLDGWQVAEAVRKLPDPTLSHVPIIALSANDRIDDRRRSIESGIDVHLPKPMELNVVLDTIKRIVKTPVQ